MLKDIPAAHTAPICLEKKHSLHQTLITTFIWGGEVVIFWASLGWNYGLIWHPVWIWLFGNVKTSGWWKVNFALHGVFSCCSFSCWCLFWFGFLLFDFGLFVWGFGGGLGVFFLVHLKKLFVILSLIFSRARVSGIEGFKANSIGLRG